MLVIKLDIHFTRYQALEQQYGHLPFPLALYI